MTQCFLYFVILFCMTPGQDDSKTDLLDGVYNLVSSRNENQNWISPKWRGMMIVKDGRYSRVYQEVEPRSEISFHCNSGSFLYAGKQLKMNIQFSNYRPLVGVSFENQVVWSPDRKLLTLNSKAKENNFEEIWKRVEK